jgi:predicted GTPase
VRSAPAAGKSATARWLSRRLRERGRKAAVLRHPMPYGDLLRERVQRFASLADLDAAGCTIEEREEYEPHLALGNLVFAGVDYAAILAVAQVEADIIVWDGGNNDFPFIRPDLHIVVADALRPRQIATHHPGETVARMADLLVVNKVDAATPEGTETAIAELRTVNSTAQILRAASPVRLDDAAAVKGRRVLVIEDGPTITHGGMSYGAGLVAAIALVQRRSSIRGRAPCPKSRRCFALIHISARFFQQLATVLHSFRRWRPQ